MIAPKTESGIPLATVVGLAVLIFGATGVFAELQTALLVWVYCSSMILLFGAEFTQVCARAYGSWKNQPPKVTHPPDAPLTVPGHFGSPSASATP